MMLMKKIVRKSSLGRNKQLVLKLQRLKYDGIKKENRIFVVGMGKVRNELKRDTINQLGTLKKRLRNIQYSGAMALRSRPGHDFSG